MNLRSFLTQSKAYYLVRARKTAKILMYKLFYQIMKIKNVGYQNNLNMNLFQLNYVIDLSQSFR